MGCDDDDDDDDGNRENDILERKNQRSLLLVHPRLETTLVESLAEGTNTAARAAPCYETGATLLLYGGQHWFLFFTWLALGIC